MSGFQAYLDGAEEKTGVTPQGFLDLAAEKGLSTVKHGEVVTWLKTEFELGHGHAANLAQLITKGPDAVAAKYNGGEPLRLDGVAQ